MLWAAGECGACSCFLVVAVVRCAAPLVWLLCCLLAALLSLLLVWGVCAGVLLALVVGLVLSGALVVLGVSLLLCARACTSLRVWSSTRLRAKGIG